MAKGKGFDRARLAVASASTLVASLFGGVSRSARAADDAMPVTVLTAGANWNDVGNTGGVPGINCGQGSSSSDRPLKIGGPAPDGKGGGCLAIGEGSLVGPPSRTDGLDGAFLVAVNGAGFVNPDGTLDLTGTTVTSDPVVLSGLTTRVQYYFAPTQPVARAVFSFTNATQAPISATVSVGSDAGSDGNTTVRATSSGNTTIENADRWILSSDSNPTTGDPTLLLVRYGTGAGTTVSSETGGYGTANSEYLVDNFALTVPAGTTRRIMVFVRLGTDVPSNQAAAAQFDNLATLQAAGLLAGLTPAQQSELANWAPLGTGTSFVANVPSIGDLGRLALVLTLGAAGFAALRRRRDATG